MSERQRVDVWLHRARFAKTRAAATRLVTEGGVRIVRAGASRQIEKASVEVGPGDTLMLPSQRGLRTVRVEKIGARRGPPAEARKLYIEVAGGD